MASNDLNELLEVLDLGYVLDREGVAYKETNGRSGAQLNIRQCPFCHSNEYKVYANALTGAGNCFSGSCGVKFSKWSFLKQLYGQSGHTLVQTLQGIAREQGWRPKRASKIVLAEQDDINLPPCDPCATMNPMPEYLLRRGVDAEWAEYFDLRFCAKGWWEHTDIGTARTYKQNYGQRIIIPVVDLDLKMVTFQGRDVTGTSDKRYLFPIGYAATGSLLYNGFNWSRGMTRAVICEGVFDVVQAQRALAAQHDLRDTLAIGTFGMELSDGPENSQVGRLLTLKAQGLRELVFLWDPEQKAVEAAMRAGAKLMRYGFDVRVAILEGAEDPGDASEAQIVAAIANARPIKSVADILRMRARARELPA